jgi:hypothetical protein
MIYRQPADSTRGPNCGPTSVAVLTANPLSNVMNLIQRQGSYPVNWKGSTRNRGGRFSGEGGECFRALQELGANPVVETGLEARHGKRQLSNVVAALPHDRAYLICTGQHAQAVVGDRVFDQSTAPEGDHVLAFWGRRKKVNVIISVDRMDTASRKDDAATVSDFVARVVQLEAVAVSSVEAVKLATASKNNAKIKAYSHLIAGLFANKVRKGTAQAGDIKSALIEGGVSKACAKRYMENGQKAKALPWVKAVVLFAASDADAILQAFADNGVKTEQDLVNIVCPKVVLTAAEELAAKAQALTDNDAAAVQALLDAAALINPGCAEVAATLVAAL